MRALIDKIHIVESTPERPRAFDGIVYHGSQKKLTSLRVDSDRGLYFSSDVAYALDYGPYVYQCRVRLARARYYSEEEANTTMEIDRNILVADGYDGRVITYPNGEMDVVAFHPEQVELLSVERH